MLLMWSCSSEKCWVWINQSISQSIDAALCRQRASVLGVSGVVAVDVRKLRHHGDTSLFHGWFSGGSAGSTASLIQQLQHSARRLTNGWGGSQREYTSALLFNLQQQRAQTSEIIFSGGTYAVCLCLKLRVERLTSYRADKKRHIFNCFN